LKTRGIVLLALGSPEYGEMAFNLALSLKSADVKIPIAILHDNRGISTLHLEHLKMFAKQVEVPSHYYTYNGQFYPIRAKLFVDKLSPWDRSILLDVDTIWYPEKKVSWLFGELEGEQFTGQIVFCKNPKHIKLGEQFMCWGNVQDIVDNWGLSEGKIYGINAFFWYWERGSYSEQLFDECRKIYDLYLSGSKKIDHKVWRNIPVEEVCMGIATSRLNLTLSTSFYQPIAHPTIIRPKDTLEPHKLSDRYWAITFPGTDIQPHLISWYNQVISSNNKRFNIKTPPFLWRVKQFGIVETNVNRSVQTTSKVVKIGDGKFNLKNQLRFEEHRSGWGFALDAISDLHSDSGIIFDGFLEQTFAWGKETFLNNGLIPYKSDWVGIMHNPPTMAPWYNQEGNKPIVYSNSIEFKQSLNNCKGIYVLSDYMNRWLSPRVGVPVETLIHPTETPSLLWKPEYWKNNSNKRIIQLGYWLRKLTSIYLIDSPPHIKKTLLVPRNDIVKNYLSAEIVYLKKVYNISVDINDSTVHIHPRVSNDGYDKLLANNIAFLDLYDTSCNNAVIECIVRNTPLLINKHTATVEYLGEKYPLYFENLSEASSKLHDESLLLETYNYLFNMDKERFTGEYFKKSVENSKIYMSLK
jgi:hypothetical protein